MNVPLEAKDPSPQTTLVILLGASAWPLSREFQSSEAFANAARRLKTYFLNSRLFGLPAENLLDLFDSEKSADELDEQIGQYLEQRFVAMRNAGNEARDLIIYFIGHGGFVGRDADLYLAIRRTRMNNPRVSGIYMLALADTLTEKARYLRRIVILDCCFAAAAFSAFQSGPDQVAVQKTVTAFLADSKSTGFPTRGTSLLCSSSHKSPSLLLPDNSSTMFTKAFLDALLRGMPSQRSRLSLRDVKEIATDLLYKMQNAPKPVVLSPDQSEGDIADIPFFPNPQVGAEEERHGQTPSLQSLPSLSSPMTLLQPPPVDTGAFSRPSILRPSRRTILLVGASVLITGTGGLVWDLHQPPIPAPSTILAPRIGTTLATFFTAHTVAWSPDGKYLVSGGNVPEVRDVSDPEMVLRSYKDQFQSINAVAWSPDGKHIASSSNDKTVQIWDAMTANYLFTCGHYSTWVGPVAWSPDSKRIVLAGDDTIQIWDAITGKQLFTNSAATVVSVAWSPDGKYLASANQNNFTVQIWDANTAGNLLVSKKLTSAVLSVAWSPDSQHIASGDFTNVQIWDAITGEPRST